jgi:hypothetical protein
MRPRRVCVLGRIALSWLATERTGGTAYLGGTTGVGIGYLLVHEPLGKPEAVLCFLAKTIAEYGVSPSTCAHRSTCWDSSQALITLQACPEWHAYSPLVLLLIIKDMR